MDMHAICTSRLRVQASHGMNSSKPSPCFSRSKVQTGFSIDLIVPLCAMQNVLNKWGGSDGIIVLSV